MKEPAAVATNAVMKPWPGFTLGRFLLDGPVLPLITNSLPLAEAFRAALLSTYQRRLHRRRFGTANKPYRESFVSQTLSGKDTRSQPLQGHGHAYFVPSDEDDDGRIDHVTVFAAQGFTADEVQALDRLRQVRHGEGDPLRLLLVGLGTERDVLSPVWAESAAWVSATPFLVSRYPKMRGTKRDLPEHYATPRTFAEHVLRQELERFRERRPGLPAVVAIQSLEVLGALGGLRPIQFRLFRQKRGDDGGRRPSGAFRIVFASPMRGPLCLGHSCHFGLGLFVPDRVRRDAP
jgi:CRISPR-associated protein Csb2